MVVLASRVSVLVKALPQPSSTYGETVCCAGITAEREWKRLFPVRFRQLTENSFGRWDWVTFQYRRPTRDSRNESCHVYEESLKVDGLLRKVDRAHLVGPMILGSTAVALERGQSLALIRPRNTRFFYQRKSATKIEAERKAYRHAARQTSMLDRELAELDPSPYVFRFKFEDDAGKHDFESGDWETHAMFRRERKRKSEAETLRWMDQTFNDDFPRRGMIFAVGNQAKRPRTWQLLGVIRVDDLDQQELPL